MRLIDSNGPPPRVWPVASRNMKSWKNPATSVPSVANMATGPLKNVLNITPMRDHQQAGEPDAEIALDEVPGEGGVAGAEVHVGLGDAEILLPCHRISARPRPDRPCRRCP